MVTMACFFTWNKYGKGYKKIASAVCVPGDTDRSSVHRTHQDWLGFRRNVARSWCVAMHHVFGEGQNSKSAFVLNMHVLKGLNSFNSAAYLNNDCLLFLHDVLIGQS